MARRASARPVEPATPSLAEGRVPAPALLSLGEGAVSRSSPLPPGGGGVGEEGAKPAVTLASRGHVAIGAGLASLPDSPTASPPASPTDSPALVIRVLPHLQRPVFACGRWFQPGQAAHCPPGYFAPSQIEFLRAHPDLLVEDVPASAPGPLASGLAPDQAGVSQR